MFSKNEWLAALRAESRRLGAEAHAMVRRGELHHSETTPAHAEARDRMMAFYRENGGFITHAGGSGGAGLGWYPWNELANVEHYGAVAA